MTVEIEEVRARLNLWMVKQFDLEDPTKPNLHNNKTDWHGCVSSRA